MEGGRESDSPLNGLLANRRLLITSQELHTQRDAIVPGFRHNTHKPGIEGDIKDVILIRVVVVVALEYLHGVGEGNTVISTDKVLSLSTHELVQILRWSSKTSKIGRVTPRYIGRK